MKKLAILVGKVLLSAACAVGLMCIGMMQDWNGGACMAALFLGGILIALFLGVFDISDSHTDKHLSIKQGARSMRPAA